MYSDPFFSSSSLSITARTIRARNRCPSSSESFRNVQPIKSFGSIVTMRRLTLGPPSKDVNTKFSVGYLDQINILSPRKLDAVTENDVGCAWLDPMQIEQQIGK
jgi:hypothetical protein